MQSNQDKNHKLFLALFTLVILGLGIWLAFSSKPPREQASNQEQSSFASSSETKTTPESKKAEKATQPSDKQSTKSNTQAQGNSNTPEKNKPINKNPTENSILSFFSSKGSGNWKLRFNPDGEPFRVIGGEVPGVTRDLASVKSFMAEVGPEFGIPSEELTENIEHKDTRNLDIYDAVQTYQKHEVFDAYFRVIGASKDGAGIIFNNTTKPVNKNEVILPAPLSAADAEKILREHYGDKLVKIKTADGPVVWAGASPHQAAYKYQVRLTDDDHLTLVGAQSKAVIYSRSERMHNSSRDSKTSH